VPSLDIESNMQAKPQLRQMIDAQHSNKKEIKTLADAQAALLAKFIVANARMQSEIYRLLTPEQKRKLDGLKRSSESGTVASR
jgi:Spy/CpxP family protein refolding chaperone